MNNIFRSALIIAVACCYSTFAEESIFPAVSGFNGKLDYSGGWMESQEGHNFSASISAPLGKKFGVQADGLYTRVSNRDFFGGGGHLFWRNPEIGLIGLSGGGVHTENVLTSYQGLIEGEYYLKRFTIGALAGVGHISYDVAVPFINSNPTMFVGTLSLNWYVIDNLRVGASYSYLFENQIGQAELEYQTPWKGFCLTAEYARGENDYDHALFGVRFYFGKEKTLKARHREDDPPGLARHIMTGVGLYGAKANREAEKFFERLSHNGGPSVSFDPVYGAIPNRFKVRPPDYPPIPPIPARIYHLDSSLGEGRIITDPSQFPPGPPTPP